jgi:hypothetical protein
MGMGPVSGAFQNGANNVQSGMGGKGKGGGSARPSYPPQGGMGGKGKGGAQAGTQPTQNPYVPPTQPQVQQPAPQQYYQPQYQPDTFQNPYAQGGFGQQMGGMGGKGGQMGQYQQIPTWLQQGGMGGKGGQMGRYPQRGGQIGIGDFERRQFQQGQQPRMSEQQWSAQAGSYSNPAAYQAAHDQYFNGQSQGGMGGKGGQQNMNPNPQYNMPQNQGLAALQQPTATTQALTPEQPYMGNYLQ